MGSHVKTRAEGARIFLREIQKFESHSHILVSIPIYFLADVPIPIYWFPYFAGEAAREILNLGDYVKCSSDIDFLDAKVIV